MDSNAEQFGQIYDQYIEKIYRFVYLKVNSQEAAEDLTSKVFIKGWEAYQKALNSPDLIKNPGAFLYQIARNTVVDYYREKGRTRVVSAESLPQLADNGTNLQDVAEMSADLNVIKTAILKLKKDYQDIIIWHYLDDRPIAYIAKAMGKPAGTVRVMLHRGLKDLKEIINEA